MRALPLDLAQYIAPSARCRSSSWTVPWRGYDTTPALTDSELAGAEALVCDARPHPLDDQLGGGDVGVDQREHELVAADAAADVARTQLVAQGGGHRAQGLVADRVPECAVDRLEVVEVERHDGYGVAGALGAAQLLRPGAPGRRGG